MAPTEDLLVTFAQQSLGKPYVWGGTGPNGFDCSGLVFAAMRFAGITSFPRLTAAQIGKSGEPEDPSVARPGDVVYYDHLGPVDHVGIYIGNGQMIDAPDVGGHVQVDPVGKPTSYRRLLPGDGSRLPTSDEVGQGLGKAADALNPLSGWSTDATKLALYVVGAAAAAGLVIVGAVHTVHT